MSFNGVHLPSSPSNQPEPSSNTVTGNEQPNAQTETAHHTESQPPPVVEPSDEAPSTDAAEPPPLPDEDEPDTGADAEQSEDGEIEDTGTATINTTASADPPLPDEEEPSGAGGADDGWEPVWEASSQAYYFYNRYSKTTQWENPRVPSQEGVALTAPGLGAHDRTAQVDGAEAQGPPRSLHGGYNPAIHGDYDPNADYAKNAAADDEAAALQQQVADAAAADIAAQYVASGSFNRFTGRWQNTDIMNPDNHNDENKSKRQMSAYFDVDAAANAHDGRSLKAERAGKRLTKQEVKAFKEKRRERKEEKRRAWLRD